MKILFLSQRFLFPMDAGGKIRTGKILEQLSRTEEITVISNTESPKDDLYLAKMQDLCTHFIPVPWQEIHKHSRLFVARLLFQMFSMYPVSVLNSCSKPLQTAVEQEYAQRKYDVAICDFVQSALEFRNIRSIPTILFQHNVESMIAKRHIEQSENLLGKLFWWLQWKKMFRFEAKACKAFDTVIAVSDKDKETFQNLYRLDNVVTIPTGVDVEYFQPIPDIPVNDYGVAFCGSLDWLPNEDAVLFFINDILPLIKPHIPNIRFIVIGKNPSPALQKLVKAYPEVTLTGWVEDTRPYIAESAVFIVPLRIGGGTRMKIYEAMAMGKTVVSTSIGAEGLPVDNGEHLIIADQPDKFAENIITLLNNRPKRESIGTAARIFVREYFAWKHVAEEFHHICKMTIKNKGCLR